ncbi:MlaD family protein [Patulibacter minatonensis]|uniref:MlaD family protein n=1 Tax=Patulibacter minatonensis TaxID=298163 RepID=UPI000479F61D|nr:MlaD family protein [Patulibacter minatonensis]
MNPRKVVTGALVAVVVIAAFLLLTKGNDDRTITAEMPNAGGLRKHSSVKIGGVPGGSVEDLKITGRDTAIVKMKLDKDAWPIGKDASIKIRPTDLLGERYVALEVGNLKDPAPKGFQIAESKVKLPVELDDVINTFDGDTRTRIKVLVNEFGIALGDQGKDLAKLLDAMPASLDDARQLVSEINTEDASLKTLLARGDSLTATVSPKRDQLADLITQAQDTLGSLATRREELGATLDSAPAGLAALNTTLSRLRIASTDLRPASVDLQRTAGPLKDTLEALPGFEESARQSLKAAKSAAPSLTKLGKKATPPLQALTPTLANVKQFSSDLKPTLDKFDERSFEDALWMVQQLGLWLKTGDRLGRQAKVALAINSSTVKSIFQSLLNRPDIGGTQTDNTTPKSGKTQTKSAPTTKTPAPQQRAATPPPTTSNPTTTGSSPATSTQDKGLLGGLVDGVSGLLGGNAGTKDQPGAGGVSGLLNNLLKP